MKSFALKELPRSGIERAIEKAEHYRALNDPENAESICRDVLAVEPEHPQALVLLGLALADQLVKGWSRRFDEVLAVFGRLGGAYERAYYTGIAWERCGNAQLELSQGHNALHSFREAMAHFEAAEELAPEGVPDPVLRWNRCVRALESEQQLRQALREADESSVEMGD